MQGMLPNAWQEKVQKSHGKSNAELEVPSLGKIIVMWVNRRAFGCVMDNARDYPLSSFTSAVREDGPGGLFW